MLKSQLPVAKAYQTFPKDRETLCYHLQPKHAVNTHCMAHGDGGDPTVLGSNNLEVRKGFQQSGGQEGVNSVAKDEDPTACTTGTT